MSASTSYTGSRQRLGAVAGFVGFLFAIELSSGFLQGWFSPVLAGIAAKYAVTPADLNWVQTTYLLASAVLVPLIAKMGDRHGHKRMLAVAAALTAAGSLLVALAPSYGLFLAGRFLSGALVAFLPLEFAILRERAGEEAGKAIGLLVGGLTLGGSAGLVISGQLADSMSLTALLLIPAVLMCLAVVVVVVLVPETTARSTGRLDWAGALLLGSGLAAVLYGVSTGNTHGWTSGSVLGWIAAGAVVLVVWVVVEQRVAHPLIPFSAFAGRGGLGLPILMAALFGAQLFGSQTPLAIFLGTPREVGFGLGLAPGSIGWVLFAWAAAMFVGTVLGPRLTARTDMATAIVVGSVATAASQFLLLAAHETTGVVLAWLIISGVGNGIIVAVLPDMVVNRAPADSVGIASGLYNTARTVAGAVAAAAFTAVMSGHLLDLGGGTTITDETGYEIVWTICGVLVLCVGLLAPLARRRSTGATPAPALAGATAADS